MKSVLFGKLGQEIIFDRDTIGAKRSNTNGNYESYNMLRMLMQTDNNILCVSDNIQITMEQQMRENNLFIIHDDVPNIDVAFILMGMNVANVSNKLLEIINSGIKWYAICTDPRCLQELMYLIENKPQKVFAGMDKALVEICGEYFETEYLNVEAANVFNELGRNINFEAKHDKLVVVSNATNTWDRIGDVCDMVSLVKNDDVRIYGRHNLTDMIHDERLRGEKDVQTIFNLQALSKVSYVSPISPGWITAKYLECICRGVVPLLSNKYATNVFGFLDDITCIDPRLVVDNPEQLKEMYELITSDDEYYSDMMQSLVMEILSKYGPVTLLQKFEEIISEV